MHKETITQFNADGSTEIVEWDLSKFEHLEYDERFYKLGYKSVFNLGDDLVLSCSVLKKRDENTWLFQVYDQGECILLVLTEGPLAFTRYLKEISETCLAAHEASELADEEV